MMPKLSQMCQSGDLLIRAATAMKNNIKSEDKKVIFLILFNQSPKYSDISFTATERMPENPHIWETGTRKLAST